MINLYQSVGNTRSYLNLLILTSNIFQVDTCRCNNVSLSEAYLNWNSIQCPVYEYDGVPVDIQGFVAL